MTSFNNINNIINISDKILSDMSSVMQVETDGNKEYLFLSKEQNSVGDASYGLFSINTAVNLVEEKCEECSKAKKPLSEQVIQNCFLDGKGGHNSQLLAKR
jgi:hypothetical protein